jgi:hypothetical protein
MKKRSEAINLETDSPMNLEKSSKKGEQIGVF